MVVGENFNIGDIKSFADTAIIQIESTGKLDCKNVQPGYIIRVWRLPNEL